MSKYWYEIFLDKGKEGTETLEGFNTLAETRKAVKTYRKNLLRVGIDKWTFIDGSPENIKLVEEIK